MAQFGNNQQFKNNIKTEKPIKLPPQKQWKKNYVHKLLTRNTNLLLKNSVNSINLNLMKINRNKHHSIMTEKLTGDKKFKNKKCIYII